MRLPAAATFAFMKMILRLIAESFLFAGQSLVVNKLRTILSLLGVTIGIFSIILVLSVVDSLEADMKKSFDMIGSDILFVQKWPMGPEEGDEDYAWWKYMSRRQPSLDDMDLLKAQLSSAEAIAFQASTMKTSEYRNNFLKESNVLGVSYEYDQVIALKLEAGRYFTPVECDGGTNYAIIGNEVKNQLFGGEDPIGKEFKVGGLKVVVIGVFKKEGASLFGSGFDSAVMLPVKYASRLISIRDEDTSIMIKAIAGVTSAQLRDEVMATMRAIRGVKPKGDNPVSVIESKMISSAIDSVTGTFSLVASLIGVFAIAIGGFSVANIMFVSVRERTNIIGIQKALGAKNYFILTQFLFEAIALCIVGALVGVLLVWISISLMRMAFDFDFILPLPRVLLAIGISVGVGILSGIIPAVMASRLNPVDAIRSK